ncbi:hypothetical protein KKC32_02685 [Patescibacteria group bacterium]|nr:hypothetical protein [Patescibacteria group bacterium]
MSECTAEQPVAKSKNQLKLEKALLDQAKVSRDLATKAGELGSETKEKKRATLESQIVRLDMRAEKIAAEIRRLNLAIKKDQLAELAADIERDEIHSAFTDGNCDKAMLKRIIASARKALNLRATRLVIEKDEKESLEFLRGIVSAYPSGWTANDDAAKRYKYFLVRRLMIILQDTPSYGISVDALISWLGEENAAAFIVPTVDKDELIEAIKRGSVRNKDGEPVTFESWEERRTRKVGKPKVVIEEVDPLGRTKVAIVKPELMSEPVENLKTLTSLTGHEVNPLMKANIRLVAEIRGFSGEELTAIPGIGHNRAEKIIDAICMLSDVQAEESAAQDDEDPEQEESAE